jgi:hypothetical protein
MAVVSSLRATTQFTTAPAGSGKTFVRGPCFIEYFIGENRPPADEEGRGAMPCVHWSNFPLRLERWTDEDGKEHEGIIAHCARVNGLDERDVADRIKVIPEDVLAEWRAYRSGPWEFFRHVPLGGCHIAIDEAHNYIPARGCDAAHKKRWQEWLGEARHMGCTVEFLTQNKSKIDRLVENEAGVRISLFNTENLREPIMGALLEDWYELSAGFLTGRYVPIITESERIEVDGKWVVQANRSFWLDPKYFPLYDSYSRPQRGGVAGKTKQRAFKRLGKLGLLAWFVRRNFTALALRAAGVAFFLWLVLGGGTKVLSDGYLALWTRFAPGMAAVQPAGGPSSAAAGATIRAAGREHIDALPAEVKSQLGPEGRLELESLAGQAALLSAELVEVKRERDDLAAKGEEVERQLKEAFAVAMVTRDTVTFRGGYSYGVGEEIDFGEYKGRRVESIDWVRRTAVLDDGAKLRMGIDGDGLPAWANSVRGPLAKRVLGSDAEPGGADVPGGVSGAGGAAGGESAAGPRRTKVDDVDERGSSRPVLPVGQQRNGGVNRGGATPRPAPSDHRRD